MIEAAKVFRTNNDIHSLKHLKAMGSHSSNVRFTSCPVLKFFGVPSPVIVHVIVALQMMTKCPGGASSYTINFGHIKRPPNPFTIK